MNVVQPEQHGVVVLTELLFVALSIDDVIVASYCVDMPTLANTGKKSIVKV